MNELTKIDLNQAQVLQRTREALSQLIEGWEMGYDDEPRDEVRLVASLLDLLWEQSPEGIAHAEEWQKKVEANSRKYNERVDAELASEAHRDALAQEAEEMRLHNESLAKEVKEP